MLASLAACCFYNLTCARRLLGLAGCVGAFLGQNFVPSESSDVVGQKKRHRPRAAEKTRSGKLQIARAPLVPKMTQLPSKKYSMCAARGRKLNCYKSSSLKMQTSHIRSSRPTIF